MSREAAIFYAGSRVFLSPSFTVGDPGALTSSEETTPNIPLTRERRREMMREKRRQVQSQQNARPLSAKEEKKQKQKEKKQQQKIGKKLAKLGGLQADGEKNSDGIKTHFTAQKRNGKNVLSGIPAEENRQIAATLAASTKRNLTLMEDSANWEQKMQAGCVFWQNIFTRKIQKHMPLFKNLPITTEAKERYIYGTGNALYQKQLWDYGQEWKKKMQLKVKEPSALQHLSRQKLPSLNLREEFNRSKPNERERKSTQSDDSSALLSREDQNDATLISQSAKNSDSSVAHAATEEDQISSSLPPVQNQGDDEDAEAYSDDDFYED